MRSPKRSGFRLPEAVKLRVVPKLTRLEVAEGLSRKLLLDELRYDLGLLDPKRAAQHEMVEAFAVFARTEFKRRRYQASARRIIDSVRPTLGEMRRFLRASPRKLDADVIDALLDIPKARQIEAVLSQRITFKWDEKSATELRDAPSATRWLDAELGKRLGKTAGQFHEFAFRGAVAHRVRK